MKVVLHIGLPKTATSFLQSQVFPHLGSDVVFNPADLFHYVNAIFTLGISEPRFIEEARRVATEYANRNDKRTLFISSESLSQFCFDATAVGDLELIRNIFPTAEIIVFVRNQIDWLESCYREAVKQGYHQRIEEFLCYRNGAFGRPELAHSRSAFSQADVMLLNWATLLNRLRESFGPACTHSFFYEEFRADPARVVAQLCKIIGVDAPTSLDLTIAVNRGLSATAIGAILASSHLLRRLGFEYPTQRIKLANERARLLAQNLAPNANVSKRRQGRSWLTSISREVSRTLRKLHPIRQIIKIDRRLPVRRREQIIQGELRRALMRIFAEYNRALTQDLVSLETAKHYFYEAPTRLS